MKVRELIAYLEECDQEATVFAESEMWGSAYPNDRVEVEVITADEPFQVDGVLIRGV